MSAVLRKNQYDLAADLAKESIARLRLLEKQFRAESKVPHPRPFCTDDYGSSVYRCHWTKEIVWAEEAVITPGFMPGSSGTFIAKPGYEKARKESHRMFADHDANCNTCQNLIRVKHEKVTTGFLMGRCKSTPMKTPQLFTAPEGMIRFHPDDRMAMTCYVGRL